MSRKSFGAKIYALRTANQLTQTELSGILHIMPAAVSDFTIFYKTHDRIETSRATGYIK